MAKETVTSTAVAKRAGVSQSAVSRVFTPGASVSKKTAEKVRKAAAELGYRPNRLARSLIKGQSRIIGLVVAYLENQFYPTVLEKLSQSLQKRGYHVLIFVTNIVQDDFDKILEEIMDYQIDGLIAASLPVSADVVQRYKVEGVPVVMFFNRFEADDTLCGVTADNFKGGRKVANFLAAGGHQRIAYLAGHEAAATQIDREAGFLAGLAEHQLTLYSRGVGGFDFQKAQEATRHMFDVETPPDALFAANDHMAFAAMDTIRFELGLRIPEDVSVVGYDDVPVASWPSYDLTTIHQPMEHIVDLTVEVLLGIIEDQKEPAGHISLDGPLVVRRSARIPDAFASSQDS